MNRHVYRMGIALLLATIGTTPGLCADSPMTIEDERATRTALADIAALRQRFETSEAALHARIDQLDLGRFLEPSRLASTSDLQAARASLVTYRALLVESDRLTGDILREGHALLAALPDDGLRAKALRNEAELAGRRQAIRREMLKTQVDNADAMDAVIDWADRHHALVHLSGANLAIDGQRNLDEFRALEARLDATARLMTEAADRAAAEEERAAKLGANLLRNLSR